MDCDGRRDEAMARLRSLKWPLPPEFRLDREAANRREIYATPELRR
jgi:hypothetical protein